MTKKPRSRVPSDRRGPAAGRRAPAVKVAGAPSRTQSAGNARATSPAKSRTDRADVDWRYLTPAEWPIVIDALTYYLSTHVSTESRAPIVNVLDSLTRQEPTV